MTEEYNKDLARIGLSLLDVVVVNQYGWTEAVPFVVTGRSLLDHSDIFLHCLNGPGSTTCHYSKLSRVRHMTEEEIVASEHEDFREIWRSVVGDANLRPPIMEPMQF
jgi:hypothetical protein